VFSHLFPATVLLDFTLKEQQRDNEQRPDYALFIISRMSRYLKLFKEIARRNAAQRPSRMPTRNITDHRYTNVSGHANGMDIGASNANDNPRNRDGANLHSRDHPVARDRSRLAFETGPEDSSENAPNTVA